jgi:hypothetical protein
MNKVVHLIKHHAMKMYGEVEVKLHAYCTLGTKTPIFSVYSHDPPPSGCLIIHIVHIA